MESDGSLQQKVAVGGGGGRSKLSLRRKKDKDPPAQQHPSPPPNPTNLSLRITPCDILTIITPKSSKTTSTTHSREGDRNLDTSAHDKTAPMKKLKPSGKNDDVEYVHLEEMGKDERTEMELQHVPGPHISTHDKTAPTKELKPGSTNDDVEYISLDEEREEMSIDERTKMELQQVSSPHPADIDDDDDDEGLGDFYFCHICQKDLTRFSESRRQTHINRCCDKQEEEKERIAAAAAKEGQSSAFSCLLCKKSFKSDNVRLTIIAARIC